LTKKIDYDKKKVDNVQVALEGLENGMTIMLGGFGLCGIPENSIAELVKKNHRSDLYIK
jgi:3-oxoacid CoA-transferase subunit A